MNRYEGRNYRIGRFGKLLFIIALVAVLYDLRDSLQALEIGHIIAGVVGVVLFSSLLSGRRGEEFIERAANVGAPDPQVDDRYDLQAQADDHYQVRKTGWSGWNGFIMGLALLIVICIVAGRAGII